ncbi:MAG TPA: PP2C family protein-serine/threonine phosphatase [Gemmataceae bacterium]|jgi:sigma-B regulation protein RsbU (phosphoserine phosphatase)|nr:PP2C family protein-serine/threonine phosphatase [Gemmataceae bacterium]
MLSMSIHSALRSETLPDTHFDRPGDVLEGLNRVFRMEDHNGKFFTLWYGVYDRETRGLRYASAGHPPAILFDGAEQGPVKLGVPGLMIGVAPGTSYATHHRSIQPGSLLYLFSDGVFEVQRAGKDGAGRLLGVDGLVEVLARASCGGGSRVENALRQITAIQGASKFADDFSLLEFEFK